MGGQKKAEDYSLLINQEVFKGVKACVFVGECSKELLKIAQSQNLKNVFLSDNLTDATKSLYDFLKKDGGILLFSPACASFDSYKNFEERGNHFCTIVNELINKDENI